MYTYQVAPRVKALLTSETSETNESFSRLMDWIDDDVLDGRTAGRRPLPISSKKKTEGTCSKQLIA